MKKRLLIIFLLFVLIITPVYSQMMLQPVAAVNLIKPEMISREQLDAKIEEMQAENPNQVLTDEAVLKVMINDVLVLQGAERAGIVLSEADLNSVILNQKKNIESQVGRAITDEEFSNVLLQATGMGLEAYKESVREQYIVSSYIRSAKSDVINSIPAPSEDEIEIFYKKNAASFINSEYVKLSHIYFSKSNAVGQNPAEKAGDVLRELNFSGKSFDDLVVAYSQDENTKFLGGNIGWFAIDDTANRQILGDDFFDVVFALEEGEISEVVESVSGYHIVRIDEHRYPKILGLDDTLTPDNVKTVRQYISQTLYVENQQNSYSIAVAELVQELLDEAEVTILL